MKSQVAENRHNPAAASSRHTGGTKVLEELMARAYALPFLVIAIVPIHRYVRSSGPSERAKRMVVGVTIPSAVIYLIWPGLSLFYILFLASIGPVAMLHQRWRSRELRQELDQRSRELRQELDRFFQSISPVGGWNAAK
jgi:hypothetical protein